jgi:hypothetical protein
LKCSTDNRDILQILPENTPCDSRLAGRTKTAITGGLFMDEKKTSLKKNVEDTMACSAFAEAGEPCPINTGEEANAAAPTTEEKESILESVEETMACTAFAEEAEPCPEENIEEGLSSASHTTAEGKESILESVEDTLACSAFSEEGEPCPENIGEKKKIK